MSGVNHDLLTENNWVSKMRNERKERSSFKPEYIGIGVAVGVAVGAAIGVALGNIAIGVGIGAAVGCGLGVALGTGLSGCRDKQNGVK